MTQAHERTATLSDLVAEEVRALMARRKVSGRELATKLGVSPSWISYRLSGKQPIDVNDMLRIANALDVGVHDLLPPPEIASRATEPRAIAQYLAVPGGTTAPQSFPSGGRPPGRRDSTRPADVIRTARLPRGGARGHS